MSGHPVDDLIRELALTRGPASGLEIATIRAHVAGAEFLSADSLEAHLEKRKIDGQWAEQTTVGEYLDDLRGAIRQGRLGLFARRGGVLVAAFAETEKVIPPERLGGDPEANLFVVYASDRGKLITGYQYSEMSALALPLDVIWLD